MAKYCAHLKQELFGFLEELSEIFADDVQARTDLKLVQLFFRAINEETLMAHVIKFVLPHEKKIAERKEKFFIENTDLYKGLPENKVNFVSQFWLSGRLTGEDKEALFAYFDCFVELAKSYKKCK